jgi:hypothetical protein
MRLTIFALFLSAGSAALCQSSTPAPANPNSQGLTPPQWSQPGQDFSAQLREWHFNTDSPQRTIILQAPLSEQQRNATQIDPKIIVHPPQSSLGEQPPAAQIAQNLYPGLTLMPISEWKGNGHQVPITWPNLKVQNIPIVWQKLEIKSVENGTAKPAEK